MLMGKMNIKNFIKYNILLLIALFIVVIILYEKSYNALYIVCVVTAGSGLIIGQTSGLNLFSLGMGQTRKKLEIKLLKQLLFLILYSLSLMLCTILFILIIYRSLHFRFSIIFFTYLISLILSQLSLYITLNSNSKKKIILGSLIIIGIVILLLLISNKIVSNILLLIFLPIIYFENRYSLYHKEI